MTVRRSLASLSFTLPGLIAGARAPLSPCLPGSEGYLVRSAPRDMGREMIAEHKDMIAGGWQSYRRYYVDMAGTFEDYMSRFSGKTRSTLRRKSRKLADQNGGLLDIREYRTPKDLEEFYRYALPLSRRTYQARLLDAGLPEDAQSRAKFAALAASDNLRAYLLFMGDEPIAYLFLPIQNGVVKYAWLGYDDDAARLSPGTVLQLEALERLFAEQRYRYFDFTEGEGAHKALFGTDSAEACSFYLLRPSLSNRALIGALAGFDRSVALGKAAAQRTGVLAAVRKKLRG